MGRIIQIHLIFNKLLSNPGPVIFKRTSAVSPVTSRSNWKKTQHSRSDLINSTNSSMASSEPGNRNSKPIGNSFLDFVFQAVYYSNLSFPNQQGAASKAQ